MPCARVAPAKPHSTNHSEPAEPPLPIARPAAHKGRHDATPHAPPGLRTRPGRAAGPALRHAGLPRGRRVPRAEIPDQPERLSLVLPGACPRLQRRLGFLQRHVTRRGRSATSRRHLLAAPDLADRQPGLHGLGRGRAERPAAHPGRGADEDPETARPAPGAGGTARAAGDPGPALAHDPGCGQKPLQGTWRNGTIPMPTAAAATPRNA